MLSTQLWDALIKAPVLHPHPWTFKAQTALHIAEKMVPGVDVKASQVCTPMSSGTLAAP